MKKVVVVLPAYNCAQTLKQTIHDIPRDYVAEIIVKIPNRSAKL